MFEFYVWRFLYCSRHRIMDGFHCGPCKRFENAGHFFHTPSICSFSRSISVSLYIGMTWSVHINLSSNVHERLAAIVIAAVRPVSPRDLYSPNTLHCPRALQSSFRFMYVQYTRTFVVIYVSRRINTLRFRVL